MTINCKGQLLDLSTPKVMGILNVTPDSFFDGGHYTLPDLVLKRAEKILSEGAEIIDLGGYSSRPNALEISENEEIDRVVPFVEKLVSEFPEVIISIDTFRGKVAEETLKVGAAIINDISGFEIDEHMFSVIVKYKVPYILMHMRGTPKTMQSFTEYTNLTLEVNEYFINKIKQLQENGVKDIILDPGFGFSKTTAQNYELFAQMEYFKENNKPLLVGISRKSMIYKKFNYSALESLNATTALNMLALQKGANILRVHDVREAVECISIHEELKKSAY